MDFSSLNAFRRSFGVIDVTFLLAVVNKLINTEFAKLYRHLSNYYYDFIIRLSFGRL